MKYITFSKKNTQSNFAVNHALYRNALRKLSEQKNAINALGSKVEAAAKAGSESGWLQLARQNLAKANKIEDLKVVASDNRKTTDVIDLGGPQKNKKKKTTARRDATFDKSKYVYVEGFGYADIKDLVPFLKKNRVIPHHFNPTKDQLEKIVKKMMQKGNRHGNPKGRQGKQNGNNNKSAFNPLA